ncbi:MAG: hypothetical protein ABH839_03440, partial [Chloroflexota bacterium]
PIIFLLLFLYHLIRPPYPQRSREADLVITYNGAEVELSPENVGLPKPKNGMQWILVHMAVEARLSVEIKDLALQIKSKEWSAYQWQPNMSDKIPTPCGYHFQIPTSVDLKKCRAELVASTNDEDYGTGKFQITH